MKPVCLVSVLLCFLALSAVAPTARAQSTGPILSLNPGGHTATIDQVLFSPDGKEMLSVGEDKVVRFWDAATGKPMPQRNIRGQAGEGTEGKPYAAALSPDGNTLAIGGFIRRPTLQKDANGDPVYDYLVRLIDPHTGRQLRLLTGPHNAVLALAFSPKGGKLAAGSADHAVTVWDLATGASQANTDHEKAVYGVAFSPDGSQVASVSSDKNVRIWDLAANRSRVLKGHDGVVRCVAWSPDGQTLATGGFDRTLRLWDPALGKLRQTISEDKSVTCVAFSPDGHLLAVGQGADVAAQCAVQLWAVTNGQVGKEPLHQFLKHTATVQAVAFAPSANGVTVASAGGVNNDIYLWNGATGAEKQHIVSTGGAVGDLVWSPDNSQLAWKSLGGGGARVFDLTKRSLVKEAQTADWQGAVTEQGGHSLAIALDNPQQVVIKSGGREAGRITLTKPGDFVRCFTWTKTGRIIVGSAFGLGLYNADGKTLQSSFIGHAADVLSVSVSPDGKYLASGSGDQTVKIWPLTAGANPIVLPLLSLFVGGDGEWVLWSHFGFYACSPDGENIIGWQINQGDDQSAEYYPASRVGRNLHREDIISHLLETGDETKAIALADAETHQKTDLSRTVANLAAIAPPDVQILNYKDGDTVADPQAALKVSITDPNGRALQDLQVTDNGQPVTLADAALKSGEQTLTVPLTDGENTISLLATNDAQSASNPVSVRLTYKSAEAIKPGAQSLTVLCIGVSKYDSPVVNQLEFPAKDARDVAAAFKAQEGKLFSHVDVMPTLTDDDATRENIITALGALRDKQTSLKPNDYTVVFVAGHGTNTETGDYYFAPFDIDLGKNKVEATGVDWSIFTRMLSQLPGHVILMLDTCHSAGVNGKVSNKDAYGQYLTALCSKRYNNESPLIMLTSCDQNEISLESRAWNNGAFTHELVAGLNGEADANHDGCVTIKELSDFVHNAVLKLTDDKQTPRFVKPSFVADSLPITIVSAVAHTASAGPSSVGKTTP